MERAVISSMTLAMLILLKTIVSLTSIKSSLKKMRLRKDLIKKIEKLLKIKEEKISLLGKKSSRKSKHWHSLKN
jgi:hypothetical protein